MAALLALLAPEPAGAAIVAMVVEPDIEADNGVIHGIDWVLLPPEALRSF
jgi:uncharacterized surface protein with fasciclin (FAS1) repeats